MRKLITAAVLAVAFVGGTAGTAVAQPVVTIQKQSPASEASLKEILSDYHHHVGESLTIYGEMYNVTDDSHAAFATAGPNSDSYVLNGTSIELSGPGVGTLAENDYFTATVTITGNEILGDPELRITTVQITGHDNS